MGKSEWDGYDYKTNYDSSISYDDGPSSYRIALEFDDVMIRGLWKIDFFKSRIQESARFEKFDFSGFLMSTFGICNLVNLKLYSQKILMLNHFPKSAFLNYQEVNEANPILELKIAHTRNQMNFQGFFLHLKRNFLMLEPNSKLIFFKKWWTWKIWLNNSEPRISMIIKMFLRIMIKSKSRVNSS